MNDLILKEAEYKEQIIKMTNEIGLPAFIIKPIIKDLYEQLVTIEKEQYQEALRIKQQEEEEKKKKEEEGKEEKEKEE